MLLVLTCMLILIPTSTRAYCILQHPRMNLLILTGKQDACEVVLSSLDTINEPMRTMSKTLVEVCAYAGTGNVLKIQRLLQLCYNSVEELNSLASASSSSASAAAGSSSAAAGTAEKNKKADEENKKRREEVLNLHQGALLLSIPNCYNKIHLMFDNLIELL